MKTTQFLKGKDSNRSFAVANTYMKRLSSSLIMREMQTAVRCCPQNGHNGVDTIECWWGIWSTGTECDPAQ